MPSSPNPYFLLPLLLALGACAVGPDYQVPQPQAPADWRAAHAGDAALLSAGQGGRAIPAQWWTQFADPALDYLQRRATAASPDLQSAALRFAQARMQRQMVAAQRGVNVDGKADVQRQRQSERGASHRRDQLAHWLLHFVVPARAGPGSWARPPSCDGRRIRQDVSANISDCGRG